MEGQLPKCRAPWISSLAMGKTTFEDIWDEYLELLAHEKAQFLYDASITLGEQGNETAQRAVLHQAIEDAFEVGDSLTAANATVELSKQLVEVKEFIEATIVITGSIERLAPWQSFELGLLYRSLAWSYRSLGDTLKHEECLKLAIAHFDSCYQTAWSYPLRNEMGEALLSRHDWSSLANLLSSESNENDEYVAPIARGIRGYLLGRLALHELNLGEAISQLLVSVLNFEKENHRLLEEALESLSWAFQQSGEDISQVIEPYEYELTLQPSLRHKLVTGLPGGTKLFL